MDDTERNRLDALLDLLADEVARRLAERWELERAEPGPPRLVPPVAATLAAPEATVSTASEPMPEPASEPASEREPALDREANWDQERMAAPEPDPEPTSEPAPNLAVATSSHAATLMARLAIGVFIIVALINIPFNAQGTALARSIPPSASLVIRNGLVVKESTSPEIWVYRDGSFHWITSLDALEHFGYTWKDVHIVEPGFLNQFDKGSPLYVLLKCDGSPNIYRLDGGQKRWIVDIATFTASGYVWGDVKFVPCTQLRGLPDGDSIPPGRGSPPTPSP